MTSRLRAHLADPFLRRLWDSVRAAGPLRSISVDLTHACNLRCTGCYFFEEGMDRGVTMQYASVPPSGVRNLKSGVQSLARM